MKVEFYTLNPQTADDQFVGRITHSPDGFHLHPAAGQRDFLANLFSGPVYDHASGQEIDKHADPEGWLQALVSNYHSPYLRATKAK